MARLTAPTPQALALAKALHAVPSVRALYWTGDRYDETLYVYIASWEDADFNPCMDAEDEAISGFGPDWDGVLETRFCSVLDRNIAGGPVRIEPEGARPL